MDTRTGDLYPSRDAALAAGVPEHAIVTGDPETLARMSEKIRLQRTNFETGGTGERRKGPRDAKRRARVRRQMAAASRKRNRR